MRNFRNITGYLGRRESLRSLPFGEVDNLVLSQLAFLPWDGIVPGPGRPDSVDVGRAALRLHGSGALARYAKENRLFNEAAICSPRFSGIRMCGYVNEVDMREAQGKQFSAVTFLLPNQTLYLAFRGTDDCFAGWTEDVSLTYLAATPSQEAGRRYLEKVAAAFPAHRLLVGGHSKGGNIALYAALHSSPPVRGRLHRVYNNDGPGLERLDTHGEGYRAVHARIRTFMPQASTVGMLMSDHVNVKVIHSRAFGGVPQHDPFSWEVQGNFFRREPKGFTAGAKYLSRTLNGWIYSLPHQQRAVVAQSLCRVLSASGVEQGQDLSPAGVFQMVREASRLGGETWRSLGGVLVSLLKAGVCNLPAPARRQLSQA